MKNTKHYPIIASSAELGGTELPVGEVSDGFSGHQRAVNLYGPIRCQPAPGTKLYTTPRAAEAVSEEMVERACNAYHGWWKYPEHIQERPRLRVAMRAALTAAPQPATGQEVPSCPAIDADKPTDPDSKRLAALADWMDVLAPGRSLSARTYLLELSRRLATPQPAAAQGWPSSEPGYTTLFNAIAAATSNYAGIGVNVSVSKFLEALAAAPQPQEAPAQEWKQPVICSCHTERQRELCMKRKECVVAYATGNQIATPPEAQEARDA